MTSNLSGTITKSNMGYLFLIIATIVDIILPFILAPYFKKYNSLTMVMSLLGNKNSPVHTIYNFWLITAGVLFILGGLKIYTLYLPTSNVLSKILLFCIVFYAIGACILSGIFSVGETKALTTLPEKIHGYGSVLGFFILTFVPLIIGILSFRSKDLILGAISIIFFILVQHCGINGE